MTKNAPYILLVVVVPANNCADSSERRLEWHSVRSEGHVAAGDHMALVREHSETLREPPPQKTFFRTLS